MILYPQMRRGKEMGFKSSQHCSLMNVSNQHVIVRTVYNADVFVIFSKIDNVKPWLVMNSVKNIYI